MQLKKMLPAKVQVRRAGTNLEIEVRELLPGDIMLLFEGDKMPTDGRPISSNELKVDLSSLTKDADSVETPIRVELQHFIKIISSIAIILGTLFFLVSVAIGDSAISSLIFAAGIIVANVPEGLLPKVTLLLTMTNKRMARKNALRTLVTQKICRYMSAYTKYHLPQCLVLCPLLRPPLNIFGTAPLGYWHLSLSIPFAILILIGDELRRVFVRRGNSFVLKWLTW